MLVHGVQHRPIFPPDTTSRIKSQDLVPRATYALTRNSGPQEQACENFTEDSRAQISPTGGRSWSKHFSRS